MSRHGCGSISLAKHARRIVRMFFYIFFILSQFLLVLYLMYLFQEMKEGAPLSKVRLFHNTHMRKTPEGSQDYIDQHARQGE